MLTSFISNEECFGRVKIPLSTEVKKVHYHVQQKVKPKLLTPEEIVNLQNQILIERGLCTDLRHNILFFLVKL